MKKKNLMIAIFLIPTILLFLLAFIIPIVKIFYTSLFDWHGFSGNMKFIGLSNYIQAFTNDHTFNKALMNTIIWVILQSVIHVAIGTVLAIILARKPFGWKFIRTSYMIPNMIAMSGMAIVFKNVFNPQIGIINSIIRTLGFKNFNINWYYNPNTAFATITMTWLLYAGLIMIMVLAEIKSIPKPFYEAAEIDGATEFQKEIYITIPLLRNILGTCVIIAAASQLTQFELIYLSTNGGPGDMTLNLPLYLYRVSMLENNYSYSNTIGSVLIIFGIIYVALVSKLFRLGKSDK